MINDRETIARNVLTAAELEAAVTLITTPAIVTTFNNDINFLACILTHVTKPKRARLPVETPAPRVAQAPGVKLWTTCRATTAIGKRIVLRDIIFDAFGHILR